MAINNAQAYRGNIDLQFDDNGNRTKILNEQIIYIMIEENYTDRVLPIVYISLSVNNDLFNNIINKRETAKFFLSIAATDVLSYNSINSESLSELFNYIPESTNADFGANLNYAQDSSLDTSYRTINIGLVSEKQTQLQRTAFNGVYKDINASTLISLALQSFPKVIVEPVENNNQYDQIVVPPVPSVYKFLEFLFNYDAFYNTQFRFFMGFNVTYLLSKRGIAFTNSMNSVIIDVQDITNNASLSDGMEIKNGAYYVYVNQMDVRYTTNQATQQITNQIVSYDEDAPTQTMQLNNNGQGRSAFIRTSYGNVIKNEADSDEFIVEIVKHDVDGSIFTPEKQYSISGNGEYAKFNGNYILVYKKVFYKSTDGMYKITTSLGFQPASDNETAHTTISTLSANSKAVSVSAKKTKTATAQTNTTSRSNYNKKNSKKK